MISQGRSRLGLASGAMVLILPALAGFAAAATVPYGVAWRLNSTTLGAAIGGSVSQLNDIALCSDGNLVVVGSGSPGGYSAAYIAKVTKKGSVLWAKTISSEFVAFAVTAGSDGSIFVGGGSGSASGTAYFASYDASGNLRWSRTLGWGESPRGLAMDTGGNVLMVGRVNGLEKYSGLSSVFINSWGGPGGTTGRAVAVDASGNVFVASSAGGCSMNYVSRYDEPTYGSPVHTQVTTSGGCGEFNDIHVGPGGVVYAFGGVDVTSGSGSGGNSSLFAVMSPAGALVGAYSPSIPTAVNPNGPSSSSGNGSMTSGAVLPSGLVVASWQDSANAGVSAGSLTNNCGPSGCFDGAWAASTGTSFTARRLLVTDGGWLFAAGSTGNGGDGPDDTRWLLVGMGDAGAKLPGEGKLEIRKNVIRTGDGDRAVIVLKGTPGANVELSIYGPSGAMVGQYDDAVSLDASGVGSVTFDGTSNGNGGFKLGSGVYWIVARDGVKDRKPVLVIGLAQGEVSDQ